MTVYINYFIHLPDEHERREYENVTQISQDPVYTDIFYLDHNNKECVIQLKTACIGEMIIK